MDKRFMAEIVLYLNYDTVSYELVVVFVVTSYTIWIRKLYLC